MEKSPFFLCKDRPKPQQGWVYKFTGRFYPAPLVLQPRPDLPLSLLAGLGPLVSLSLLDGLRRLGPRSEGRSGTLQPRPLRRLGWTCRDRLRGWSYRRQLFNALRGAHCSTPGSATGPASTPTPPLSLLCPRSSPSEPPACHKTGVMELSAGSELWAFAFFCRVGILVSSESFTLKGSDSPVIATVGTDAILPCQLSPRTSAKQMEVRWHSSEIPGLTHHYVNGQDAPQKQNAHYRGRTELFKEELPNGNVSLLLKKVQVADGGSYVCFIGNKLNYFEGLVELKVGAVGTGPTISVHRSQDQAVTLTCSSEGWYPEPAILWTDMHGQRQNSTVSSVKDVQGLHNTQSHVDVKDNKNQVLVCQLQSNFWDQTRQSALQLSSDLFPYDKHPYIVTTVIFCLLFIILGVITGFIFKTERESKGKLQIAKELLKAQNSAVQIRLDPKTAHPNLHISSNFLHVNHTDQKQAVTDTPERFDEWACVLGSETLRAEKEYYWEVHVGNKTDWDLGVTNGKANRKGWQDLKPENGYWGIRFFNSTDYIAFVESPVKLRLGKQPEVVGIHLNGKAQSLNFYDVSEMSHIYTFRLKSSLDVYPYFCPGLNKNGKNKDPLKLRFLSHGYCDLMSSNSIPSPPTSTLELLGSTNGKDVAAEHSSLNNSDDVTVPFLHQASCRQKQEPSAPSGNVHNCVQVLS